MSERRYLVVGGAGFIGSHLVERLVERGAVTVFDNLSVGRRAFLERPLSSGAAKLVVGDCLDLESLRRAIAEGGPFEAVFHLAANPEARWGLERTRLDLEQGTIATYNVLEAMRLEGARRLVLASSGTVYGLAEGPSAEGDLGSLPISLYGASKLAGEALASAYCECFGLRTLVFRFGNVVGPRGTHGAALDFLKKLAASPDELEVLGDGQQRKPYLSVHDCASGMLFGLDRALEAERDLEEGRGHLEVYNLAPPDTTSVARIAELCVAASPNPSARVRYAGGRQGWPGDVPRSRLDPSKLAAAGFSVRHSSDEAVRLAVLALAEEVFGPRSGPGASAP